MPQRSAHVDIDAAIAAWWEKVCHAGDTFMQRAVPRWGDAIYLWPGPSAAH